MNVEKNLERWKSAGLITSEQVEAIRQFERERPSASWVIYGISGLGITVLMTGVISVIAANWQDITAGTKLGLYFLTLAIIGWAVVRRANTPGLVREALVTVFGIYVLAGIGLISQIYHLTGKGYEALFLWVGLILPITLRSESRLLSNFWCAGLTTALSIWAVTDINPQLALSRGVLLLSVPYLFLGIGYGFEHVVSRQYCQTVRVWSYAALLGFYGVLANIAWAEHPRFARDELILLHSPLIPIAAAAIAFVLIAFRRENQSKLLTIAIAATILSSLVLILPPLTLRFEADHEILGCALFILAWAAAAAVAAVIPRKRLFDLATFVIGLRFIVVYFEVFGSLAATGVGLIISGSVILAVAYTWHRYRSKVVTLLQEHA